MLKPDPQNLKALDITNALMEALNSGVIPTAQERIQKHFEDRQGVWEPLKPSTIAQRKRLGFGPTPILVRSRVLVENVASVVTPANKNGQVITASIGPDNSAQTSYGKQPLGEYIAALDEVRPFFDLNDDDLQAVDEAFYQAFEKAF